MRFGHVDQRLNCRSLVRLMPSWDRIYLLETVDEYVISELRLSEPDMIFAVLGVLLIFALVFPFLFAAIAIYGNQGSATVIVQTVIIGSTGLFEA